MIICRRYRGFAMLTAIGTMAVIGIMLLALGLLLASDGRRTIDGTREAQLRQMLLAGAAHALNDAPPASTQPAEVSLPHDLARSGASLTLEVESASEQTAQIRIIARLDDVTMQQVLMLESRGEQRTLSNAILEPPVIQRSIRSGPSTRPSTQPESR